VNYFYDHIAILSLIMIHI